MEIPKNIKEIYLREIGSQFKGLCLATNPEMDFGEMIEYIDEMYQSAKRIAMTKTIEAAMNIPPD